MRFILILLLRLPFRLVRSGGVVVGGLLFLYCGLYLLEGDRGVSSLQHLNREISQAESQLSAVKAEREKLERRVVAMRPASIDPDLLDESARKQLGYTAPNEIILLNR